MSETPNNWTKLIGALVVPIQDLEAALQQLLIDRSVDTAVGTQLDVIGRIVAQPRDGLSDDDYRRYIRARIATHRSTGTTEDLVKITRLIVYQDDASYVIKNEGTATVRITIEDVAVTDALGGIAYDFAVLTRAAGVRVVVEWLTSPPANTFRLDSGPGLDQGHLARALG